MDDSDLTMGSGTFGGIGSGNGVTPPAMPRTTVCVPDGPAACTVYELALDGSGNTTGAPAMDEQGDSTRQTTWRPFLSEPATLLHVVNGSRDAAATLAPGYGEEGGSVGPLAINVPDAVDEAHWYVKPVASLPGHTPATSGGPGLPRAPLYVCSGFNRKHGTGDDRTTAPPDAYPMPVASVPGGGDPGSADGESKASTGPCACSLGNPSVANVASTTDEGTGATKSPAGHWTDPVPAVHWGGEVADTGERVDLGGVVDTVGPDEAYLVSGGKRYKLDPKARRLIVIRNGLSVRVELLWNTDAVLEEKSIWGPFLAGSSKERTCTQDEALDLLSDALDILGFAPFVGEIADAGSAVIAFARGDVVSGILSSIAALLPTVSSAIAIPTKWLWQKGKKIDWASFAEKIKAAGKKCSEWSDKLDSQLDELIEKLKKAVDDELAKIGNGAPQPALAGGGSLDANDVKRMTGTDPGGAAKGGGSAGDAAKNGGAKSGWVPGPTPDTPNNIGMTDFGKSMGWHGKAGNTKMDFTKGELEKLGMTKELAQKWLDFYRDVAKNSPSNPSAPERVKQFEKIIEILAQ